MQVCGGGGADSVRYTTFGRAWSESSPYLGDTVLAAGLAQIYALAKSVRFAACLCWPVG